MEHAAGDLPRKLRAFVILAFVLATAGVICRSLVDVFLATRAVTAEEFPESRWLFEGRPFYDYAIWIGAGALIALLLVQILWRLRRRAASLERNLAIAGAVAGIAGEVAVFFHHGMGTLVAGLGCYAAFVVSESIALRRGPNAAHLGAAAALLDRLALPAFARRSAPILLLPALGFLIAAGAELALFTGRFAGTLFSTADLLRYAVLVTSACFITGARIAFELLVVLLVVREFSRRRGADVHPAAALVRLALALGLFTLATSLWCSWREVFFLVAVLYALRLWIREASHPSQRMVFATAVMGLYFWARTKDLVYSVLGDEIEKLQLTWLVWTLFGLLAILFALWTYHGLVAIFRRFEPRTPMDLLLALVLSSTCPLTALLAAPLGRSAASLAALQRRLALVVIPTLAAFIALLIRLNYPAFSDFSQVVQMIYSLLIGMALFLILFLLRGCFPGSGHRPLRWARPAVLGLLLASAALYIFLPRTQTLRMLNDQYTKISHRIIDLAKLRHEGPRVELASEPDPGVASLRRQGRYPASPAADFYRERRPPIFFMLWDAARHDHMSVYGYHRRTTPRAEELARDAVVFEQAYSSATATTCSMRAIFTGHHQSRYMLDEEHDPYYPGELVRREGYDRLLLNIHGSDYNGVGLESFFRSQKDRQLIEGCARPFKEYFEEEKFRRAIALLDEVLEEHRDRAHPGDGIFMYLHSCSTHFPWENWPDHEIYGEGLEDRYDNSMGHTDYWMGWFLDRLRERGLYEDAIIILTADHGTGLGEHGKYGGFQPYQEQIRVPMIIKAPGFAARRVAAPTTGIDFAPTILSLFRGGEVNPYTGYSLVDLMAARASTLDRRYFISQAAFEDALALVDLERGLKLHFHRSAGYEMLYDLRSDPRERHNLADERPAEVAAYLRFVRRFLWEGRSSYDNPYFYRKLER